MPALLISPPDHVQLDVVLKATMADAFALALKRTGQAVGRITGKA